MHAGIADPPGADIPQEQTPTPPPKNRPPGADTPPAQCMLGDTANKRAVRILLECILVKFVSKDGNGFTCMQGCNSTKQGIHIISLEPISKRPASNSFHEFSMTSVSIYVIGAFWRAMKRKL